MAKNLILIILIWKTLLNPLDFADKVQLPKLDTSGSKIDILDSIYLNGYILQITKTIPKVKKERFHLDKRISLFCTDSISILTGSSIDTLILKSKHLLLTRYELNNLIIDNDLNQEFPILSSKCDSVLIPYTSKSFVKKVNGERYLFNIFRVVGKFNIVRINKNLFIGKRWWIPEQFANLESVVVLVPKWN